MAASSARLRSASKRLRWSGFEYLVASVVAWMQRNKFLASVNGNRIGFDSQF
jgi:hypothetical protein